MKASELGSVTFKILGVYFFFFYVMPIVLLFLPAEDFMLLDYCRIGGLSLLYLVVSLCLVIYSEQIAKFIFRKDVELNIPITAKEVMTIAFASIGIFCMLKGITIFLGRFITSFQVFGPVFPKQHIGRWDLYGILRFIFGLILFIQAKGFTKLWNKINSKIS